MHLTSTAFQEGQTIPKVYTCEGLNINPPLHFHDIPKETQSLSLIVSDPDAPSGTWYHWIVFNIPPTTQEVRENSMPQGGKEGLGTQNHHGYEGPCPPSRVHQYLFTLYALDTILALPENTDVIQLRKAMQNHVIAKATLTGIYQGPAHRTKPL